MIRFLFYICLASFFYTYAAYAQDMAHSQPLEITAEDSLEWHRNELYFKANKNVHVTQGNTQLFSDILIAQYRDGKNGGMEIHTIKAGGNVRIISPQSKAYGDSAIYNVDKGFAVMKGRNLRLVSKDQTVTAHDKFRYWVNKGRLEAIGKAKAVRLGDQLEADKIIVTFKEDRHGKRTLKTLEALGNVVITTPDEVLTGELAIYQAATNIAEIHKNVRITRGPNILEGSRAQVNLETNISKIFGGDGKKGRVRGVFYPNSETISK